MAQMVLIDRKGERRICREHRLAYSTKCVECEREEAAAKAWRREQQERVRQLMDEVREMRRSIV